MRRNDARELKGCEFPDRRLGRRLERLVEQLSEGMGESIPMPGLGGHQGCLSFLRK